jgi:hypothetical protein
MFKVQMPQLLLMLLMIVMLLLLLLLLLLLMFLLVLLSLHCVELPARLLSLLSVGALVIRCSP